VQIEKTVFISYRHTNIFMARAVYQDLTAHGYDAFLDYESIDAGAFDRIILNQIAARAHFIVVLTPSALERCVDPKDWLRREVECAIDLKRNVVPMMFEGFSFRDVENYLVSSKLKMLQQYQGLEVPSAFFDEAMNRLRTRFLNKPLELILHPTPPEDENAVEQAKTSEALQPAVTENQLGSVEYFERGFAHFSKTDYAAAITDFSEAISLNPTFAEAYIRRGNSISNRNDRIGRDKKEALADYQKGIELSPNNRLVNIINSKIHWIEGNTALMLDEAELAVSRNPDYHEAYFQRGTAYHSSGNYAKAVQDFTRAIELYSHYAFAYNNRALARRKLGDDNGAIIDYTEAISLNSNYASAYNNRGSAKEALGEYKGAIADYEEALRIEPHYKRAQKNLVNVRKKL
jgi:tetratricopeptide (TPR) repeat protein